MGEAAEYHSNDYCPELEPDHYPGPVEKEADLERYLRECVQILPEVIEEEYVRFPADFAFWNARYAAAFERWLRLKVERELTYNHLLGEVRAELETIKTKATVSEVESEALRRREFLDAKLAEVQAEAEKVRLYGVMEALRSKREMLISLGAHIRLERSQDPMIRNLPR